ncbi:MAG: PKD domain-containing protein [Clostridia bacterium]|nr:PKD domain-containing protein [Clostridia bacterium]
MRRKLTLMFGFILILLPLLFITMSQTSYAAMYPAARFIVLSEKSDVTVTFRPSDAGMNNLYGLWSPVRKDLGYGHSTPSGKVFNLGRYPAGTELIFFISGQGPFFTGPGSRNGDGQVHAAITPIDYQTWQVGFEDLWGGGDRDYNDICLIVKGAAVLDIPGQNQAPIASANGPYNGKEGTPIVFSAQGSFDPDGSTVTYRWDFNNDGVWDTPWSNSNIASHTWNDDFNGTVKLEVSDGTLSTTATAAVSIINENPIVNLGSDMVADEKSEISFSGAFVDPGTLDTHIIEWDFGDGSKATGTLNPVHTYYEHGTYLVTLKVVDDNGGTGLDTLTTVVSHVNSPPILNPVGNKTVDESSNLSFSISGSDPDSDPLTFSTGTLPQGASFDPVTGTFSWTPTYDQSGTYTIRFEVNDGTLKDYEDITVTVANVNRPPILDTIGDKTVDEGQNLSFTISGSDPDSDVVILSAGALPQSASFDSATGTFSWTPTYDQSGTYTIRFEVNDSTLKDYEDITVTVANVNRPPMLDTIGDKTVDEGQNLSFTISGSDPDSDAVTFSTGTLPQGASFDPVTGIFSWTPTYDQSGVYNISFTVSDSLLTVSRTINVYVTDVPPNKIIDKLALYIESLGLSGGTENSLISTLNNAFKSLEKGQYNTAINQLEALVNKIETLRKKGTLTDEQANYMSKLIGYTIDQIQKL